jgi:hypothetical protein
MADDRAPHDVADLLGMLMRGGAEAPLCAGKHADVADFVWLGDDALRLLDAEAAALAEGAPYAEPMTTFRHTAYVQPDGSLVLAGQTAKGAFGSAFLRADGDGVGRWRKLVVATNVSGFHSRGFLLAERCFDDSVM